MKIVAVIVTCNRLELLPRALKSVSEQTRKPDCVSVVSNSTKDNYFEEQVICNEFGFKLIKNYRTNNYAGALNTGVEEIIKHQGIEDNIYFASLDDDDVWLPNYLKEVEENNTADFDLIAASYLRKSDDENLLMNLPLQLSMNDFLKGNPGIGGSNTFIRLKTLLKSGCFDEALDSSVDRDFLVRVFQQKPKYKIIQKQLVTAYTDKNRERLTINREKKIKSLQVFYYKYQYLMSEADKKYFFQRVNKYFSIEHNRPLAEFDLQKELDKAAYDIIGYAFAKAILKSIETIQRETQPHRPKDIFEKLIHDDFYHRFFDAYSYFLNRRKARFLMNYYRISGLTMLLAEQRTTVKELYNQFADESHLIAFEQILTEALQEETLRSFFSELTTAIWSYCKSITEVSENDDKYRSHIEQFFNLKKKLRKLGSGAEGIVFTDDIFVYKCFFNILDNEWEFLKLISESFSQSDFLEKIECFETLKFRFIRYPYHHFKPLQNIKLTKLIEFLQFCKQNEFVYTNIKPSNFVQTNTGKVKLIDYGKSFEPFNPEKYINTIKRAFLLYKNPTMKIEDFQKLTAQINIGNEPIEINGWEKLWRAIEPRKKEEILDAEIVSIIKEFKPEKVLDYGSGKCKTAKLIERETSAKVFVYDINKSVLINRCSDFQRYFPNDSTFNNTFDLALLNLVLCEVDNETLNSILSNIKTALKKRGKLIVSVCNPDFAHVLKTEFQNRINIPKSNNEETIIEKISNSTNNKRIDYHRPTKNYLQYFEQHGFSLSKSIDTEGINIETLEYASDFKIFVLINEK